MEKYWTDAETRKENLSAWVNEKNDDGFTPMHLASYHGKIDILELLKNKGADLHSRNNQGLNMVHVASQGDQPISLAYFRELGFNMNESDRKGTTPLHWAGFLACENSTAYLTAWDVDVNSKERDHGYTPLHVAVLSGNIRIVRKLLMKGADPAQRDNDGKLPIDIARENNVPKLTELLSEQAFIKECLGVKSPVRKVRRTRAFLIAYLIMFILSSFFTYSAMFPCTSNHFAVDQLDVTETLIQALFLVFNLGTFVLSLFTCHMDPGFVEKGHKTTVLQLLMKYESDKVCPECEAPKVPRSRHCDLCQKCVLVYDHHCPWINNCVGERNHAWFVGFVVFLWFSIITQLVLSFLVWRSEAIIELFSHTGLGTVYVALLDIVFVGPISFLLLVQLQNLFLKKTTRERFGVSPNKDSKAKQSGSSLLDTSTLSSDEGGNTLNEPLRKDLHP